MNTDGDDDFGVGPLLPPADRLWRHPSELYGVGAIDERTPRRARARRVRRTFARGLTIVVLLASATVAAVDVAGRTDEPATAVEPGTVPATAGAIDETTAPMAASGVLETWVRRGDRWDTASATVFSTDGFLVTTTGVVDDADEIEVVVSPGRRRPARLVGVNEHVGIAVLAVDAAFARALQWSPPEIGTQVEVVGASTPSSSGVIRAVGVRERTPRGAVVDGLVLTDVPVVEGTSGGVLVNETGEVLGLVNAMAFDDSAHLPGTEAVMANVLRVTAMQIIADGSARHARLGIGVTPTAGPDDDNPQDGVVVAYVEPRGPADDAGVMAGDVILAIDGERITSVPSLMALLLQRNPGERASLLVERDRVRRMLVTLGAGPAEE